MTLVKFKPAIAKDFFRDSVIPTHLMSVIDSMFNDNAAKFERNVFFSPRVDVLEKNNAFELQMALPGLNKEQISIDVEGEQITVSGERKLAETSENEKHHLIENYYGKFSRTFTLPENVDKENVEAKFENGILQIVLPKVEVKTNKSAVKIK